MSRKLPTCKTPRWLEPPVRILAFLWRWTRHVGLALKPCRLSLFMVAAGLAFLFISDQGLDTLRDFAERRAARPERWNQTLFFLFGGFLWAYGSWYWARLMYYVRLDESLPRRPWVFWIQTWMPRLIGLAAILGLAWAFYCAAAPYPASITGARRVLLEFAVISLVGAVLFLVFTLSRRRLARSLAKPLARHPLTAPLGAALGQVKAAGHQRYANLHPCEALRAGWPLLAITLFTAVVLFAFFAIDPERYGPAVGSTPILLLAAAGWIAFGSAADLFGMRTGFPVFSFLLLMALVFSFWNDNHAVRMLNNTDVPVVQERPVLHDALMAWKGRQLRRPLLHRQDKYPLFVVAAEGGGIRAAYWTATVLGSIQDRNPCFADQLFALSGVSGGSLGAGVFTALLADQHYRSANFRCDDPTTPSLRIQAQKILGEDFLSPTIAAMLYPDLFQRLWPVAITHFDRARALEHAWERAWQKHAGNARFAEPFDRLWDNQTDHWLPNLFLNSTWVETGKRLLVSNLRVTAEDFSDVQDASQFFGPYVLPFSSAVHLSARFTYVSPAGTLKKNDRVYGRAVDGGYFENSGATTALEILKAVDQLHDLPNGKPDPFWSNVETVVIHISNEPVNPDFVNPHRIPLNDPSLKPTACCNEIWSPLRTLLATRSARGVYARETTRWHVGEANFLRFGLCRQGEVTIPLGWTLSEVVRNEMSRQLDAQSCPSFDNPGSLKAIDGFLALRASR